MMKRVSLALLFVLLLALNALAQTPCQRHAEALGGFSFCPPAGWTAVEKEEQKYKIHFGPRAAVFTPNINVKDEATTYTLAAYAEASVKAIEGNYQTIGATSVKRVEQANFLTNAGMPGIRVAFLTEYKGILIRTVQYYFNGRPGQKLIVTCTSLEEDKAKLDPLFDSAMKTFRLDK
jgi:hypothetical protein